MAYLAFLRRLFAAFMGLSLLGVCLFVTKPEGRTELQPQGFSSNGTSKDKEADKEARVSPALQPWYHLTLKPMSQIRRRTNRQRMPMTSSSCPFIQVVHP